MQGAYGGLIIILIYGTGGAAPEEFYLITQSGLDILTNTSQRILVQS